MDDPWEKLVAAGLPDGAIRRVPAGELDDLTIRAAVEAIAGSAELLDPHRRELLAAWLSAFRSHWPTRFASVLGSTGEALLRTIQEAGVEPDRYLKLRRIAVGNLAGVL